jgi:hypothetical protein
MFYSYNKNEKNKDDDVESTTPSLTSSFSVHSKGKKFSQSSEDDCEIPLSSLLIESEKNFETSLYKSQSLSSLKEDKNPVSTNDTNTTINKKHDNKCLTPSFFATELDRLVFIEKKLPLHLMAFHDDIYRIVDRDKKRIPTKGTRFYVGTYLFDHFKGLRDWINVVNFLCEGWGYLKEIYEENDNKTFINSKDFTKLENLMAEMAPEASNSFKISEISVETFTIDAEKKPSNDLDDENTSPFSSHDDTFEIISNIILKPSCGRSILYDKALFFISSQRVGEYDQNSKPLPRDSYGSSYDPIIDFDSKRPILFSPWVVRHDSFSKSTQKFHKLCPYCTENEKNVISNPCGHLIMCSKCKLIVNHEKTTRCIICRTNVENFITVHI